ncbi:Asp23/Gls24 family envelope stress response protein [Streptomyces xiamenensis]|jgi:uncharacterized alkaline shock family protein YloU
MVNGELAERVRRAAFAAARGVEGVAFLRPGLADLLRPAGSGARRGPAGVRVRPGRTAGSWEIRVELAAERGHRAVEVTRAVRAAVTGAVAEVLAPGGAGAGGAATERVAVSVTVSDIA